MRPTMGTDAQIPKLISRPFLLLRLVVFVVLLLLNVLTLSFAAFNITASRRWEKFVSTGPALAVFNSSAFLFHSMLLLGERKYPHAIPPVSMVLVEVCWMSIMAVLTFVSCVLSTQHGPARMCSSTPVNATMCSSSILILPVSWMNFFIFFVYSVTLLIVTILHAPLVPSIWHSTISEIPWFDFSAPPVSRIIHNSFPPDKSDLERQTVYDDAFRSVVDDQRQTPNASLRPPWLTLPRGSLTVSVSSFTPAWAKQYNVGLTRGLHNPFDRSLDDDPTDHQSLDVPTDSVQRPARVVRKPTYDHRLHERDNDPFAAKHDTITPKVPDECSDKKHPLQPLAGFSNLPRWSAATTSGEGQDKRGIGMLMLHNPSDRASNTTVTTATAVPLSPLGRKSVSNLFPHDVREEDWNFSLAKTPSSEGWTTADTIRDTVPARSGRGRR